MNNFEFTDRVYKKLCEQIGKQIIDDYIYPFKLVFEENKIIMIYNNRIIANFVREYFYTDLQIVFSEIEETKGKILEVVLR